MSGHPGSRRSRVVATWGCLTGAWLASGATAQSVNLDTLSLFQLPGVRVVVEPVPAAAADDGFDSLRLRRHIEEKLSDAGVVVFSEDEWQVTIGNPLLLVRVNLMKPSDFFYLYGVQVEFKQLTVLARDSTIPAFATTWSAEDAVGTVTPANLASLERQVLVMVDQFLRAYAVANRSGRRWWVRDADGDPPRPGPVPTGSRSRPPRPPPGEAPSGRDRIASTDRR